jgi:ATP-binding cassette, subfamily B (MDR/TAP), member 1
MSEKTGAAKPADMASVSETMSFVFRCGVKVKVLLMVGVLGGICNGLVFPVFAFIFSNVFSGISAVGDEGFAPIRRLSFTFMVMGVVGLFGATLQTGCLEAVAFYASREYRREWFKALLRQDQAFFDVYNISGIAAQMGPNANKYRRGLGRRFGEGVQYTTTAVGGLAYAFYSSWRMALVVVCAIPLVSLAALSLVRINQSKGVREANTYKKAGSIANTAVSAIKTVLSLNATGEMMKQYQIATDEALHIAASFTWQIGLANGKSIYAM